MMKLSETDSRQSCLHLIGILAISLLPLNALAVADAQSILAASDAIRNPSQAIRVTVTLTEFDKGIQVESSTLTRRDVSSSGRH